ncbi:hypothetical protein CIL03_11495 [Virgibacillus indicus]|uniref:Uncharacterized protein n=1 Tax=Virgibacillus indicus TaxID=2024554 RepID=A0A265N8Y5_9BACI|nr:hypothetical protein [Virgibacillus indicus]OZU88271.1 hypothetical protein CIL03_11495 [Virgibacillus indicus]
MPLNRGMPTLALAGFSRPSLNTGADVDLSYGGEGSPLVAGRWSRTWLIRLFIYPQVKNFIISYAARD